MFSGEASPASDLHEGLKQIIGRMHCSPVSAIIAAYIVHKIMSVFAVRHEETLLKYFYLALMHAVIIHECDFYEETGGAPCCHLHGQECLHAETWLMYGHELFQDMRDLDTFSRRVRSTLRAALPVNPKDLELYAEQELSTNGLIRHQQVPGSSTYHIEACLERRLFRFL